MKGALLEHGMLIISVIRPKADKLSRGEGARTLDLVRREFVAQGWPASAQLFSSLAKTGLDDARRILAKMLDEQPPLAAPDEAG